MSYVNEADVVRGYKRVLQRNNNKKMEIVFSLLWLGVVHIWHFKLVSKCISRFARMGVGKIPHI